MRIIPKYDEYDMQGRPRLDASVALANSNPLLIARGAVSGSSGVNKFGRNIEIDSGITADVWDGGHTVASGGTSLLWVAPTAAKKHTIASTNAGDTSGGAGARTVTVNGLPDWNTAEVSETVTMNTATPPLTANSYVIIHRMFVATKGATSTNIGEITATAADDATVTARIRAGQGQTQMVVYGIPSTQTLYMGRLYGNMNKAGASALCDVSVKYNPEPQTELTNFLTKHTFGLQSTGTSALTINYATPKKFAGPGILKMQVLSGTNDVDLSGGFDAVLIDN